MDYNNPYKGGYFSFVMDIEELRKKKAWVEGRFSESGLADACVGIAERLGEGKTRLGPFNTWLKYRYNSDCIEVDCSIGQNCQGHGYLEVKYHGRVVLNLSNSLPEIKIDGLPKVLVQAIKHVVAVYEPGPWEDEILELDGEES